MQETEQTLHVTPAEYMEMRKGLDKMDGKEEELCNRILGSGMFERLAYIPTYIKVHFDDDLPTERITKNGELNAS